MKSVLFFTAFVLLFSYHTVSAQTVSSDNFVLKGANGKVTAQLTTSGEGTPALFFYDENNVVRISIGLYAGGIPSVVLNDNTGKAGAIMRLVNNNGNPVLVLKENGQDTLIIDKNGLPSKGLSTSIVIILAILFGFIGGFVAVMVLQKKQTGQ
jgi:hypothetical protein